MIFQHSLDFVRCDRPNKDRTVGRANGDVLAVRAERSSSPITSYFETIGAVKKTNREGGK